MKKLKIEIPSGANEIIHTLQDNGYEAFLVGGCVREGQNLETALREANLMEYKDHFTEIRIPENHTSSSLVRDLCEKGEFEKVKELVPRNVYEYLIRFYDVMNRM